MKFREAVVRVLVRPFETVLLVALRPVAWGAALGIVTFVSVSLVYSYVLGSVLSVSVLQTLVAAVLCAVLVASYVAVREFVEAARFLLVDDRALVSALPDAMFGGTAATFSVHDAERVATTITDTLERPSFVPESFRWLWRFGLSFLFKINVGSVSRNIMREIDHVKATGSQNVSARALVEHVALQLVDSVVRGFIATWDSRIALIALVIGVIPAAPSLLWGFIGSSAKQKLA